MKKRVFYVQSRQKSHPKGAKWQDFHQVRHRIPADIKSWLLNEGSLTQRLIKASDGDFEVQLCFQGWAQPTLDEVMRLGLNHHEVAQIRETRLVCRGEPWVYARSIIPASSLGGSNRRLMQLGNRSLGELLFRDPGMTRDPFEIAYIRPESGLVPDELQRQQNLWGRRSRIFLADKPLLVGEIFLPPFHEWLQAQ